MKVAFFNQCTSMRIYCNNPGLHCVTPLWESSTKCHTCKNSRCSQSFTFPLPGLTFPTFDDHEASVPHLAAFYPPLFTFPINLHVKSE